MNNDDHNEITSKSEQGWHEGGFFGFLRSVALIALVIGVIGSLIFMFRAGQHAPRLLLVLFTIWVLSPFAVLLWAIMVSKRGSVLVRATLYFVILIVAPGSLAIYGEWIKVRPAGAANAFLFVAVPPLSLAFIIIIVGIATLRSGRLSRRGDGN